MVLGSGIRKKPYPDPGVKKATDPGSGSEHWVQEMEIENKIQGKINDK
jgi:hypothetical protein